MTQNITSTDDFDDVFFTQTMCISLYSALIVSVIIFAIVRSITFTQSCMRVSVNLHDKMFSSIVSATMNFFHSNSSGRILNRFSKDIGNIDEVLPEVLFVTIEVRPRVISMACQTSNGCFF
jgi:ATP-binding cassette subfamily C (CFTR/MRP) protein 4